MTSLILRNNHFSMEEFEHDINRFFNSLFPDFPLTEFNSSWQGAPVNSIYVNRNGDWKINIAVTGFKKEDVKIDVEDNVITISASHKEQEEKNSEWQPIHNRLKTASFEKAFRVPARLAADKLKASCEDGMLTLIIPLREEAKKKQISIV
jgi:HSP20 family protein